MDLQQDTNNPYIAIYKSLYEELLKNINNINKTLELVESNLKNLEKENNKTNILNNKIGDDLNKSFSSIREIITLLENSKIENLYHEIIDMNNAGSLNNKIVALFNSQNSSLVDLNNSNSVISILKSQYYKTMIELKKSNNVRTYITWIIGIVGSLANIIFILVKTKGSF